MLHSFVYELTVKSKTRHLFNRSEMLLYPH